MRKPKCLAPNCKSTKIRSQHLCSRHYQQAQRLVKKGVTTWEKLERKGLCKRQRKGNPGGDLYQAVVGSK
jgi:hypothetical protein